MNRVYLLGRATARPRLIGATLVAGQLAGLAFAVWLSVAFGSVLEPRSWRWPLEVIAAFFLGESLLSSTSWLWFVGFLLHQLGPSLAWSLFFGWFALSPAISTGLGPSLILGACVGLVAQFVDGYFLVPLLGDFLQGSNAWHRHVGWFWSWSAHLVYGLTLGFFFSSLLPRIEGQVVGVQGRSVFS